MRSEKVVSLEDVKRSRRQDAVFEDLLIAANRVPSGARLPRAWNGIAMVAMALAAGAAILLMA